MKYLFTGLCLTFYFSLACDIYAWDGFDAETTNLVEITPEDVPSAGDTINVRDYENDTSQICLVDAVTRNRHTIEVVARTPEGKKRILVMESK